MKKEEENMNMVVSSGIDAKSLSRTSIVNRVVSAELKREAKFPLDPPPDAGRPGQAPPGEDGNSKRPEGVKGFERPTGTTHNNPTNICIPAPEKSILSHPYLWLKPCPCKDCDVEGWHSHPGPTWANKAWGTRKDVAAIINQAEFLKGGACGSRSQVTGPGSSPRDGSWRMVRPNGTYGDNKRWKAWARVNNGWSTFTVTCSNPPYVATALELILTRKSFTSILEVMELKERVREELHFPTLPRDKDGFRHVRTSGKKQWKVYKNHLQKCFDCKCKNQGKEARQRLENAVARATITSKQELQKLVRKNLPGITAIKRHAPDKANECNHYWGGRFTKKIVEEGYVFCGVVFKADLVRRMHAIHRKMLPDSRYGFSVDTVDKKGARSKLCNLEDRLT